MKRGQLVERNLGHRKLEMQHPIAPLEPGALEQSSMPRNFGVTTRKLRFRRSSSRDYSAEIALEGMCSRVNETCSTLQSAQAGEVALDLAERASNRRAPLTEFGTVENSNGSQGNNESVVGAKERVLRTSQTRVSSSVPSATESPKLPLQIYKDHIPEIAASAHSLVSEDFSVKVGESSKDFSSPPVLQKLRSGTKEPQQCLGKDDRGKENRDPQGEWEGMSHRSPLPEWFNRKPLQDITNVLAAGLGEDQQPQPKKKRNKKVGSGVASSFPTLSETPTRRKDSLTTIAQPKCSSFATPKQFSNLGKNFR